VASLRVHGVKSNVPTGGDVAIGHVTVAELLLVDRRKAVEVAVIYIIAAGTGPKYWAIHVKDHSRFSQRDVEEISVWCPDNRMGSDAEMRFVEHVRQTTPSRLHVEQISSWQSFPVMSALLFGPWHFI